MDYEPDSPDKPATPNSYRVRNDDERRAALAHLAAQAADMLIKHPLQLEAMLFMLFMTRSLIGQTDHELRRDGKPVPPGAAILMESLDTILAAGGIESRFAYYSIKKN